MPSAKEPAYSQIHKDKDEMFTCAVVVVLLFFVKSTRPIDPWILIDKCPKGKRQTSNVKLRFEVGSKRIS